MQEEREIARVCDTSRDLWIIGARMNVICEAVTDLGIDVRNETAIGDEDNWRNGTSQLSWEEARREAERTKYGPDWIIITNWRRKGSPRSANWLKHYVGKT